MLELGQPNHPYDLAKVAGPGFRVRRGPPGRDAHHPRRRRAAPHRRRPAHLRRRRRAGRPGRDHGRRHQRDRRRHHRRAAGDGLVPPDRHREVVASPQAPLGGLGPLREGDRSRGHRPGHAPVRRPARRAPRGRSQRSPPARCPERPPVRLRTARVARLLGTDLGAGAHRGGARPDRLHHHAGRRRPRRRDPLVALRLRVPRSTSSRRSPGTTATPASVARSRAPTTTGGLSPRQADRRRLRTLLVGRGVTEAMPMPFLAPGELARCGLPDDGITIANPLVAEQSVLRTSLLPGLVGAIAYNWSHRNHGVRLFEIGHTFNRPSSPTPTCPTSARRWGSCWPERDAPEAVHLWRFVAEALGVADAAIENGEVPGFHPTRSAHIRVRRERRSARSARSIPACSRPTGSASGWPTSRSTSTPCSRCRDGDRTYRPFSLYPTSDIDLAFEVDDDVPASAVEDAIRAAGGELLWSVRLFDVYRGAGVADGPSQPGLHPPLPGARSHPHRGRRGRGPHDDHRGRRVRRRRHPPRRPPLDGSVCAQHRIRRSAHTDAVGSTGAPGGCRRTRASGSARRGRRGSWPRAGGGRRRPP